MEVNTTAGSVTSDNDSGNESPGSMEDGDVTEGERWLFLFLSLLF